jgi:hypothetical protein
VDVNAFATCLPHAIPGQPIRYFRFAANSLMVYLGCTPDELSRKKGDPGFTVWLEPTWHVCSPDAVLIGSREAQGDPFDGEPDWDRLHGTLVPLIGKRVEVVTTDGRTNDLILIVEGGYLIRTFASDARDDHLWHIDHHARRLALYGDTQGVEMVDRDADLSARDAPSGGPSEQPAE